MATDEEVQLKLMGRLMREGTVVFSHPHDSGKDRVWWKHGSVGVWLGRGEHLIELDDKLYVLKSPNPVGE